MRRDSNVVHLSDSPEGAEVRIVCADDETAMEMMRAINREIDEAVKAALADRTWSAVRGLLAVGEN